VLSYSATGLPAWLVLDAHSGVLSGTPSSVDVGIHSLIVISVTDGEFSAALAPFAIEVINTNDAPVAFDDHYTILENSSILMSNLVANDVDEDGDVLNVISFTVPTHGVVKWIGGQFLSYEPHVDFVGADYFSYEVSDGQGGVSQADVHVLVQENSATGNATDQRVVKGEGAQRLRIGDHNDDGRPDVYYVDAQGDLKVFLLTEVLPFGDKSIVKDEAAVQIRVGDHDGDGNIDIYYIDGEGQIKVFVQ
jgi:hypothetical protein